MSKDLKGKELPTGIYQRKDGRYDARALINGVKIQLYGTNLKKLVTEFEAAKNKAKESQKRHQELYKTNTVNQWFYEWFDKYKKPALKATSAKATAIRFKTTFGNYIGDMKLGNVSNIDIQQSINMEISRKISLESIRKALGTMKECFESAKNNNIISYNPCLDITVPWQKTQKKELVFLTEEEQKIFLEATKNTWYEEMFYIMFHTGMRIGEIGGLKWSDVNLKNGYFNIERSLAYDPNREVPLYFSTPKTPNSYRKIPFAPGVKESLINQQKKQKVLKKQLGERYRGTGEFEDLVFITTMGSPVGRYIAERECRNIVKQIDYREAYLATKENREPKKFKEVHPHAIRHTFCSRCFKNKMDPKVVQMLMGHQNYNTTIDIYTHLVDKDISDEFSKFGSIEDDLPKSNFGLPKSDFQLPDLSKS